MVREFCGVQVADNDDGGIEPGHLHEQPGDNGVYYRTLLERYMQPFTTGTPEIATP